MTRGRRRQPSGCWSSDNDTRALGAGAAWGLVPLEVCRNHFRPVDHSRVGQLACQLVGTLDSGSGNTDPSLEHFAGFEDGLGAAPRACHVLALNLHARVVRGPVSDVGDHNLEREHAIPFSAARESRFRLPHRTRSVALGEPEAHPRGDPSTYKRGEERRNKAVYVETPFEGVSNSTELAYPITGTAIHASHSIVGARHAADTKDHRGGTMTGTPKEWVTAKEAAALIGRHVSQFYRWIDAGRLATRVRADGVTVMLSKAVLRIEPSVRRGRPRGTAKHR